jgi:F-type H+-transporting ATPase subunit b
MKKLLFALLLCASVFVASPVYSEVTKETAEAAAPEHHETWAQFAGKWINFIALVTILYIFLSKSIRVQEIFKKESDEIRESIESARKAKEEAERQMEMMDQRMHQMSEEVAKIKTIAIQEAEEEKRRILESAEKEAQRIVDMAHREIDSEVQEARNKLRKHIADLAVQKGKTIIKDEIDEKDQRNLIRGYIEEFGK